MRRLDLGIDLIWCSPYLRTRQTAEECRPVLGLEDRLEPQDHLSPDGDPGQIAV